MTGKRYVSARIPEPLYNALKKKSEEEGKTVTDALTEILAKYFKGAWPGYCSHCGNVNPAGAKFCNECSERLE